MLRRLLRLLCSACIVPLIGLPLAQAACTKPITVGLSDLGYGAYQEKGETRGLMPDMLQELGRRSGCEMVFLYRPRARVLLEFSRGELDVLTSALRTPERDQSGVYLPYGYTKHDLLLREDLPLSIDSLAEVERRPELRVGLVRGISIGALDARIEVLIAAKRVEYSSDFANLSAKLKAGRVQAAIMPFSIHVKMQADGDFGGRIRVIDMPEALPLIMGLYLQRDSVAPADRLLLQQQLAAMVREGWVQRQYARYFGDLRTRSVFSRGPPLQP